MNRLFFMCPPKDNTIPRNLKLSDLFLLLFFSLFSFPFDKFYQQTVCTAGRFPCFCMGFKPLLLFARIYTFSYRHNSNRLHHILGSTTFTVFFPTLPESWHACLGRDCNACEVTPGWSRTLLIFCDCSPQIKMFLFLLKTEQLHTQWVFNNTFCIHCVILPAIAWPWKLQKHFPLLTNKPMRWLIFYQTWCWCSEAKDKKRKWLRFPNIFF